MTVRILKRRNNGRLTAPSSCQVSAVGLAIALAVSTAAAGPAAGQDVKDIETSDDDTSAAGATQPVNPDASTIIYGMDFFARYPNAVTVLDLIRRIPAGQSILNSGGNQTSRGFSGNDDRILINGKRLAGKANDSESALGRITVDQVERIEIIRGSSPDIKVSSQESIMNIVTNGTGTGGAGSWRADARLTRGLEAGFGGFLSYGGKFGKLDYFASAETTPGQRKFIQNERVFGGDGTFLSQLDEQLKIGDRNHELSTNLAYNFNNGTTLRINGNYKDSDFTNDTNGQLFLPDGASGLIADGLSQRNVTSGGPAWEIGGDYELPLGEKLGLKILGLISRNKNDFSQQEIITPASGPETGFLVDVGTVATEKIVRISLNWDAGARHDFEFGTEMAINELDSNLDFFELQNGSFVEVTIPSSDVLIKETRNESFLVHTFKLNGKINIEASVFTEYSKIEQTGENLDRSRTFFFVKPSVDFRYNLTDRQQVQISLRRKVDQLNFGDFAASANEDNTAFGGNTELAPQKLWQLEASYERRLANDGGRIKLTGLHERYEDRIEWIPVGQDANDRIISGRGNNADGNRYMIELEASYRLFKIGLPDFIIEPNVGYNRTRIRDPFTGASRNFNGWNSYWLKLGFRHDLTDLGFSYGGEFAVYDGWQNNFADEVQVFRSRNRVELFAEYKIFGGMIMRFEAFNLLDSNRDRDRMRFLDGIAGGILTSREIREQHQGRTFNLKLRGTF